MFGIGQWEMVLLGLCCAVPFVIGGAVVLVLLATRNRHRDRE
ncbi:MAG: hypothetical protein WD872_07510 [Pirellulaceae bacterium]